MIKGSDGAYSYMETFLRIFKENRTNIAAAVVTLTESIMKTIENEGHIWIFGNGGSASTAEHFETDLLLFREELKNISLPINVNALSSNSAVISALGNDKGFDQSLSSLLERKANKRDLLILISASGNSLNLLNGFEVAIKLGIKVFCIIGFDGGLLIKKSKNYLHIKSDIGNYGQVEDLHLMFCHAVAANFRSTLININRIGF